MINQTRDYARCRKKENENIFGELVLREMINQSRGRTMRGTRLPLDYVVQKTANKDSNLKSYSDSVLRVSRELCVMSLQYWK